MRRTKVIALLLALAMIAGMLAGCSATESQTNDTPEQDTGATTDVEGKEIVFAGWGGEEESTKDFFAWMENSYSETSPNTIKWVGFTWKDTAQQLLIRNQGKEQLDVAQVDIGIFNTLVQAGIIEDLGTIFDEKWLTETFGATLNMGTYDGVVYGIPWTAACTTMIYNPELIAGAGWDHAPATVDEFMQCLEDVAATYPDVIPFGACTADNNTFGDFMIWLWTYGGHIFDDDGNVVIDSEETVKVLTWYEELLEKEYISMDIARGDARQMFAEGKVAFYFDATVAKAQAVSYGVDSEKVADVCRAMCTPVLNSGDDPRSITWGHMLVIFKDSALKEQAADFVKYVVSDEVELTYLSECGSPTSTVSASSSDTVQADPFIASFVEPTKTATVSETVGLSNESEVKTIITEEVQFVLLGDKTPEQAAADMQSRIAAACN